MAVGGHRARFEAESPGIDERRQGGVECAVAVAVDCFGCVVKCDECGVETVGAVVVDGSDQRSFVERRSENYIWFRID